MAVRTTTGRRASQIPASGFDRSADTEAHAAVEWRRRHRRRRDHSRHRRRRWTIWSQGRIAFPYRNHTISRFVGEGFRQMEADLARAGGQAPGVARQNGSLSSSQRGNHPVRASCPPESTRRLSPTLNPCHRPAAQHRFRQTTTTCARVRWCSRSGVRRGCATQ